MSQIEQLKMQLHGLADQSRSGAGSLAGMQSMWEPPHVARIGPNEGTTAPPYSSPADFLRSASM